MKKNLPDSSRYFNRFVTNSLNVCVTLFYKKNSKIERTCIDVCGDVVLVGEGERVERDGVVDLRKPLVPLQRVRQRHRVVLLEDVRDRAGHCLDEHPEAVSILNRWTVSARQVTDVCLQANEYFFEKFGEPVVGPGFPRKEYAKPTGVCTNVLLGKNICAKTA